MPVMQALILIQSLSGCGKVDKAQFQELLNMADDVSVELYVGSLAETGESSVWMAQTGVNSIVNAEAKGMASDFISTFSQLKPAQTLMGVMSGNQSEAKYFMEPNAQLQSTADKSSEFQKAYTAAVQLYGQINADQLDVNDTVQKLVKASLGSQVYYNTWSASFNGDGSHVADNFYSGQMTQMDLILSVYNAVYGYESVPGNDCLYGAETDSKIEAFKQILDDLQSKINDSKSTDRQKDLANSIDNLLNQSDFNNTVRKLMYMTRYTEINPFENESVADSVYFSNATKMDAVNLVYNVVRDLQTSIDESLKDKDYSLVKTNDIGSDFKDLNGSSISVKSVDDLYIEATNNGKAQTERDKLNIVREYQSFQSIDCDQGDLTMTVDQWAVYQDVKGSTNILTNITSTNTADYRLLGSLSVTDLYNMLLGASSDLKGYSNELQTSTSTDTVEDVGDQDQERHFDFDAYVMQYEKDNNLTDEQIQADENLKIGMFEWLEDAGVQAGLAVNDQYSGCTNIFLNDYIQWLREKEGVQEAPAYEAPATEEGVDGYGIKTPDSSDFYDENGNFDKEGYLKAYNEYLKKVGEAEQRYIDKVAEELGGTKLTGEALDERNREAEENANKIAEMWEDGTLDEVVNAINERKNQ